MPQLEYRFERLVTSRDRAHLRPGECQQATGIYHRRGDPRAHKLNGRSTFGDTTSAAEVKGLRLLQLDSGSDILAAFSGTTVYKATPGATGTFSNLLTSITGDSMDAAHANDKHYLVFGGTDQRNQVVQSDGTTRGMGMFPPAEAPAVATITSTGTTTRATAGSGFTNSANAHDADDGTFASGRLTAPGSVVLTLSSWAASAARADRKVFVKWQLVGIRLPRGNVIDNFGDTGGGHDAGWDVTVKMEVSENAGGAFTTFFQHTYTRAQGLQTASADFDTGDSINDDQCQVKITLTYNSGSPAATLEVYDVRLQDKAGTSTITTTTGVYYAISELDADEGLLSERSTETAIQTLDAEYGFTLTLPSAAINSNATHWVIWRTPDGGSVPDQLGEIATIAITETTFVDDFLTWAKDEQPVVLYPLLPITLGGSTAYVDRDSPPPTLRRIFYFRGGLLGLSDQNKRALYYAIPGRVESWPDINIIEAFPFPEHDELLDGVEIGGSALLVAKGLVIRLDDVPRASTGNFIASAAVQVPGAPGGVGQDALTVVPYRGRPVAIYISHEHGIVATTGHIWNTISDDINWVAFDGFNKSKWGLWYDERLQVILFAYSSTSGGDNDRYLLGHPWLVSEDGNIAWTGPHYGAINDFAQGLVSNTFRSWSAHPSNGIVYLEDDSTTGADSSNAYNGNGDSPLIVQSGRQYMDWRAWSCLRGRLRHTDFGAGQTCTLDWGHGRDHNDYSATIQKTVQLDGQKSDIFNIGRAQEWAEFTITHTSTGIGALLDIVFDVRVPSSREGEAA